MQCFGAIPEDNNGMAGAGRFFLGLRPPRLKPAKEFSQGVGGIMRFTGTVKWFNEAKGYGFIRREDGPDLFVHYTNIVGQGFRTLKEDDKVEFEVNEGPKGLQAVKVGKI
jgi:CspA family cold shock protein